MPPPKLRPDPSHISHHIVILFAISCVTFASLLLLFVIDISPILSSAISIQHVLEPISRRWTPPARRLRLQTPSPSVGATGTSSPSQYGVRFFGRRSVSLLIVPRYRPPPPPQAYYNNPPPPQQYQRPAPQQNGYQQGGYQQLQQSQGNYRTSNGGYVPPTGAPVEASYHHTGAGYTPPSGTPQRTSAPYGAGAPSESSST